EPTSILQLVLCVEAEEIGCALSIIIACDFLGRIDNVGKREVVLRGESLHVVEGVLRIGVGVVWHDGDRADPDFAQRVSFHHDAADRRLHVRTVITDEDYERALRPSYVGERIGFAVYAIKSEVACLPTEGAYIGGTYYHEQSTTWRMICDGVL